MGERISVSSDAVPASGFRELVAVLKAATETQGADFFVIGALARDLLLEVVHGAEVRRATRDVDVAVALSDWGAYEAVVQILVDRHDFVRGGPPHRLEHSERDPLDLVPFGGLEDPPGAVAWDSDARVMSTLGLREAYETAVEILLDGDLPVKVASLEGQALLKLVAWRDRPFERRRDAEDFCLLLRMYYDVREELVYSRHLDVLGGEGFSMSEASGRIYGREVTPLLKGSPDLKAALLDLLVEQTADPDTSDLARAMGSAQCFHDREDRFKALRGFLQGLREGRE